MSTMFKSVAAAALLASLAACATNAPNDVEEFVIMDPVPVQAPITVEPVFTGKYN